MADLESRPHTRVAGTETTPLLDNHDDGYESDTDEAPKYTYGTVAAMAMLINYIIGTGCFSLPYAFTQAGIVLATGLLIGGGLMALCGGIYTVNALARANGVRTVIPGEEPDHHIGGMKLDFPDVSGMFYGEGLRKVTQVMIFLYAAPWAHGAILASSLATFIVSYTDPGDECNIYDNPSHACYTSYYTSLAIFTLYGGFMVTLDIGRQARFQEFLTFYRILALTTMFVTLGIKLHADWDIVPERIEIIGTVRWAAFAAGFGPALNAMANQYSMPDVIQPMRDKSWARAVGNVAFTFCTVVYVALGLMGSLAFDNVNRLISINWTTYTGCGNGWDRCEEKNYFGDVVQVLVSLFPVMNVISSFCLQSITVGDSVSDIVPGFVIDKLSLSHHATKVVSRWLVGLSSVLVAAFLLKLDKVFTGMGIMGILLGLVLPSALELRSASFCAERWGKHSQQTPYSTLLVCNKHFVRFFNLFAWCLFFLAIFTLNY